MSLDWLYTAIAWVLKLWHSLFVRIGMDPDAGITWTLSIFFLVVTVRILLFRFFVKQVKSQRSMQELQPDIAKLKEKFGTDRQGMAKAQQELFKERGVNPLSGCLPILLQAPVFLALFHVLRRLRPEGQGLYSWDEELTNSAAVASLFGAPISSSFNMDAIKAEALFALDGVSYTSIRIVAFALMILMALTTYITQKQIMRKSGPVEGQAAMIQKFMLYVIPISLFVSGFFFPIGVLLYWFMNNLWTMGQQFYILHKHPPKAKTDLTKRDRPAVDPKALAPKPGAKPTQSKGNRRPAAAGASPGGSADAPSSAGSSAVGSSAGSSSGSSSGDPAVGSRSSSRSGSASGAAPVSPVSIDKAKEPAATAGGSRKPASGKRPGNNSRAKRKKR